MGCSWRLGLPKTDNFAADRDVIGPSQKIRVSAATGILPLFSVALSEELFDARRVGIVP